ncbi:MAG: iron ABC transporter permease [Deltaproteobacteria bacterium]|nr:iron ABC transporter permease [Deltaproteobacteria bacterium]MBW2305833.1 iron ABC transporter permease [Deltaproteobacteria bacterium]
MKNTFWNLTALLIFIAVIFFLVIPVTRVLTGSFQTEEGGSWTLDNFKSFSKYRTYWKSLANSISVSLAASALAIIVAVPLSFMVSRWNIAGKPFIIALSTVPLMLPSFISAFVWIILLGRAGLVTGLLRSIGIPFESIYGHIGVTMVFALQFYPYVFLMTLSGFNTVDESIEEAGRSLGTGPIKTFLKVSMPLVLPSILSGTLLVFMTAIENFGVPMIIGEQRPFLAVQAYTEFTSEIGQHPGMAYALSVVLILVTMTSLMAQRYYLRKRNFIQSAKGRPLVKELRGRLRTLATVYCFAVVSIPLIPFFVALIISFMEMRGPVIHPNFSLQNYIYAFTHSARPIFNSYFLATMATLASIIIGVPAGYILTRRRSAIGDALDLAIMLPFTIAGTVLGIALIVMFNTGILVLTGTWMILALSYTIRKMPFIARSSSSILYQLDPSLEEASISLGVTPMKTFFKVTIRLMAAGIISGAILTWVTTISELSSTIVLQTPGWSTMTVEMFQGIISDDMGMATSFASILIVSAVIPLLIMIRRFRDEGSALF